MDKLVIIKPKNDESEIQLNKYIEDGWNIQSISSAFNGSDIAIVIHLHKNLPPPQICGEILECGCVPPNMPY